MNKDYLKELEEYLNVFEVTKKEELLTHYVQATKGLNETQILNQFGTARTLASNIYKENQLNEDYIKTDYSFKSFFRIFNTLIGVMSKNDIKSNLKILFDFLLIIGIVALMKIPFIFIRDMAMNFTNIFTSGFFVNIWYFILEGLYIIAAIYLFIRIFKRWFANLSINVFAKVDPNFNKELEGFTLKESDE